MTDASAVRDVSPETRGKAGRRALVSALVREYPAELQPHQREDVDRIAEHVGLLVDRIRPGSRVCDLGGGIGLFSLGCAAVGFDVLLVDDFGDDGLSQAADRVLDAHARYGVDVRRADATLGLDVAPGSLAAVTCFHAIEHWTRGPAHLFADVVRALEPGGVFVLAGPNAVNLRKRIAVPLGFGNWSKVSDWYAADPFRGHVREPTLSDLTWIARRMGLVEVETLGRNWLGRSNARTAVRAVARSFDPLLRLRPTLCSDIYVIGRKPRVDATA
jgi:SAM-dependent methyltransferase